MGLSFTPCNIGLAENNFKVLTKQERICVALFPTKLPTDLKEMRREIRENLKTVCLKEKFAGSYKKKRLVYCPYDL